MEHTPAELSSTYSNIYEKYLHADTARSIHNVIWRYNLTAKRLRYWGGRHTLSNNRWVHVKWAS